MFFYLIFFIVICFLYHFIVLFFTTPYIICFKSLGYKLLTSCWYEKLPYAEERLRIVDAAAAISLEDARSKVYETKHYPPADNFLDGLEDHIPESLRRFVDSVILTKKKGDFDKWKKKSLALADCLLSAMRPVSYLSPLQVGVSGFLYRKYGSRRLLDVLSSFGYCATYSEATRFEVYSIMHPLWLHTKQH
uniref:Uncharacterized protein n=1 Tax=Cacopsylla melanoneura TaxID=428564 RepID=A0A8D9A1X7_9HEMI